MTIKGPISIAPIEPAPAPIWCMSAPGAAFSGDGAGIFMPGISSMPPGDGDGVGLAAGCGFGVGLPAGCGIFIPGIPSMLPGCGDGVGLAEGCGIGMGLPAGCCPQTDAVVRKSNPATPAHF